MRRITSVLCLAGALLAGTFACGRDSTGPVPVIAGSYVGVSSLGQMDLHITQTGRQLSGQGYFLDRESVALFTVDGRVADVRGGHRITMALPSSQYPEMSVSEDHRLPRELT